MRLSIKHLDVLIPALEIAAAQYDTDASAARQLGESGKRISEQFVKQAKDCDDLREKLERARESIYNHEV